MSFAFRKQLSVSPFRVVLLLSIVFGSLILVEILGMLGISAWPTAAALWWHARKGSTISMEGHSFHVPLLYEPEVSKAGRQLDIMHYPSFRHGLDSLTIEEGAKKNDLQAGDDWRQTLLAALKKNSKPQFEIKSVDLHGKRLGFICIAMNSPGSEALICKIPETNLIIITSAFGDQIKEVRSVLETSD